MAALPAFDVVVVVVVVVVVLGGLVVASHRSDINTCQPNPRAQITAFALPVLISLFSTSGLQILPVVELLTT